MVNVSARTESLFGQYTNHMRDAERLGMRRCGPVSTASISGFSDASTHDISSARTLSTDVVASAATFASTASFDSANCTSTTATVA